MKLYRFDAIEAALCIWEWLNTKDGVRRADLLNEWFDYVGGTAEMRTYTLKLATIIVNTESDLQRTYGCVGWNQPYDWEIIPEIMERYLDVIKLDSYREDARRLAAIVTDVYKEDHEEDLNQLGPLEEYEVDWSKTYVANGTEKITARSAEEARATVEAMLGDLEGSMQYYPEHDVIDVRP